MTLQELSLCYEAAAVPLRLRLRELRQMLALAEEPEEIWHTKRRIAELSPMLTQMNELADLTAHYYDRGYYRNEKYTVCRLVWSPASPGGPDPAGPDRHSGGTDGAAAVLPHCLLFPTADHDPDRQRPGRP